MTSTLTPETISRFRRNYLETKLFGRALLNDTKLSDGTVSSVDGQQNSLATVLNGDGTLTTIVEGLNQPTSVEIIKNTAYIVTLAGEMQWRLALIGDPYQLLGISVSTVALSVPELV